MKTTQDKTFKYKKWLCRWDEKEQQYYLYTPGELENPPGFRYSEMETATKEQAKEFINNY